MAGSLVGVSWIAASIGATRRGQIFAALFAVSVPMGVLQASSTQNDYVVAFWAVCLLSLVVLGKQRPLSLFENVVPGARAGDRRPHQRDVLRLRPAGHGLALRADGLPAAPETMAHRGVAGRLGSSCWSTLGSGPGTSVTYGGPYGTSDWLRANLTFLRCAGANGERAAQRLHLRRRTQTSPPEANELVAAGIGRHAPTPARTWQFAGRGITAPGAGVSNAAGRSWIWGRWARMIAYNFVTPSSAVNAAIRQVCADTRPCSTRLLRGLKHDRLEP